MDNHKDINVASQETDSASVLNFYRRLLAFRREHATSLIFGTFEVHDLENTKTFTFSKKSEYETLVVVLNFSAEKQEVDLPGECELLIGSAGGKEAETDMLEPYGGRVYRVV